MRVNDQEIKSNVLNSLKYHDERIEECSSVRTLDSLFQKQFSKERDILKEELEALNK